MWRSSMDRKSREQLINRYVLSFDPSGEFTRGKGTTGWCIMDCLTTEVLQIGTISARDFDEKYAYWDEHIQLIRRMYKQYGSKLGVTVEDYILYKQRVDAQINSNFETCRVIGIIEHYCWSNMINCNLRFAVAAKTRWTDEILEHKGIIKPCLGGYIVDCAKDHLLATHELDAIRHAAHYTAFENLTEEAKYERTRNKEF